MESQLAGIFERILGLYQRARRDVEEVDQPCQEKAKRRAPSQQRQRVLFRPRQLALASIGIEQGARLGDVEGMIRLEAPGIDANRNVVSENVVARERKIDQPGHLVTE